MQAALQPNKWKLLISLMVGLTLLFSTALTALHPVSAQSLASLPPSISFLGGWDQGVILGPGAWDSSQWMASDRFQLVTAPVRKGSYAIRVEVRPGDDPINSSGERAEVRNMRDLAGISMWENESSNTQYYATSVYLPADWRPPAGSVDGSIWGTFLQLHGPDVNHASPVFELGALNRFYLATEVGDLDYCPSDPSRCINKMYSFSDGSLNLGHWTDFVIRIHFAKSYTGTVDIWRRNEGQTSFTNVLSLSNVPTLQFRSSVNGGAVGDHYWKTGFYRSPETFTNVLWIDGPVRGDSFDAVVAAAFPAVASTPVASSTATSTKAPTATSTLAPTATLTKAPTATSTLAPTATSTKAPTATSTKAPTATSTPYRRHKPKNH